MRAFLLCAATALVVVLLLAARPVGAIGAQGMATSCSGAFTEAPGIRLGERCETPVKAAACRRVRNTVRVHLDDDRYPFTADHILDAIRNGERRLLHIDRRHADEHREEALRGIPTKPGFDRDEYPPAASREGGRGADVRYVPFRDNRGAGSSMGSQLRPYCEGQAFRFRVF